MFRKDQGPSHDIRARAERNRPGSPYAELDLTHESAMQKVGAYYIRLQQRHGSWEEGNANYCPPESSWETEIEFKLLETFVRQNGRINFWDFSNDLEVPPIYNIVTFDRGCENFVQALGLTVKPEQ